MLDRIRNEPVLVTAFLAQVIGLLVAFGVDVSDAQKAAVIGVASAVLAFVARSRVTPI